MSEHATCYVDLDEKELRSIITRRAQAVALASRENVSVDKLHALQRDCLIAILNLGDLEKKRDKPIMGLSAPSIGELIDDEVPL